MAATISVLRHLSERRNRAVDYTSPKFNNGCVDTSGYACNKIRGVQVMAIVSHVQLKVVLMDGVLRIRR